MPEGYIDDEYLEPDGEDFEEATGNAGATVVTLYQQASLIMWPKKCSKYTGIYVGDLSQCPSLSVV